MVSGEAPQTGIVASVTPGPTTLVYCVEEERLGFTEGDLVSFSEVQGMQELHSMGPFRVKSVKPYMLELDVDSSGFTRHIAGASKSPRTKNLNGLTERELVNEPFEAMAITWRYFVLLSEASVHSSAI
jgi:ubiquitin-activating enzyme E1